ncbi:MAG TPA: hypothetical protein VH062_37365 [Polyangiaceae bacterium]|nr:hypothetical protein [Polyangiaceae bacterium]
MSELFVVRSPARAGAADRAGEDARDDAAGEDAVFSEAVLGVAFRGAGVGLGSVSVRFARGGLAASFVARDSAFRAARFFATRAFLRDALSARLSEPRFGFLPSCFRA